MGNLLVHTNRALIETIGAAYIAGEIMLTEAAEKHGIDYDTLVAAGERSEWGKLREECKTARLRAPIDAVLRLSGGNGHQPQVQIDLAGPMLAYHAAADKLRVMIERAQLDWDEADGAEERGKVETRLDRLLERQRIMLRIPAPGRDSSSAKRLPAEPSATEV